MSLKAILKNVHDRTHELLLLKYIDSKVKEERERCAKIAEKYFNRWDSDRAECSKDVTVTGHFIAKAIREQG